MGQNIKFSCPIAQELMSKPDAACAYLPAFGARRPGFASRLWHLFGVPGAPHAWGKPFSACLGVFGD